MESLADTVWDVVLSGTGLSQSLLALALSRSGKRVLHVDKNDYYGGAEATFSLQEVGLWVDAVNDASQSLSFRNATVTIPTSEGDSRLSFSRAYSISLSPQLIYTRSNLIPALVSSKVYRQLEFLAVGSWWIYEDKNLTAEETKDCSTKSFLGRLSRIPGGREDVFQDKSIDLKSTRSLMKFLKLAADAEAHKAILERWGDEPFSSFLQSEFNIPPRLQAPLLALTASMSPPAETLTNYALPRIHRHLTSIGLFGQGFNAIIPKWGGLAEVAQVACRAGAVGGGVYVLKKGIEGISNLDQIHTYQEDLNLSLQGGEEIKTRYLVGTYPHLVLEARDDHQIPQTGEVSRSVTIVYSSLSSLFPIPAEGASSPAGAVVFFATGSLPAYSKSAEKTPPVFLMVHSSDTGECPKGQSKNLKVLQLTQASFLGIIYAQVSLPNPDGSTLLTAAVREFLGAVPEDPKPDILWSLYYSQVTPLTPMTSVTNSLVSNSITNDQPKKLSNDPRMIQLPDLGPDLALEDSVLRNVKAAWERIVGEDVEAGFMIFEDRESMGDEDDGDDDGF